MKKFNKYISLAVVAITGAGFVSSCDTSKDNDFVSENYGPEGSSGVYFSNTENAYLEISEDQNSIVYKVYRDIEGAELTVGVTVSPVENYTTNIYTFPSSVTFAAGSKVADFEIGYDFSKAEMGVEQQYELTLDTESSPFASNNVVITLVNPAPWNLLGTGQYFDYGWGISPESTGPVNVSVWQQGLDKNLYRVSNPYVGFNGDTESFFEFRVLQKGDIFMGTQVTESDLVGYSMYYINYDPDDQDDIYLAFPGLFFDDLTYWANNRVIDYREDGLPGLIQLGGAYLLYNSQTAYNYPDFAPYIEIYFPGYEAKDTNIMVNYEGILTPENQNQQVLLTVDLGADITTARAAAGNGSVEDIIEAIVGDNIEYTEFNESGSVLVPFGNENPTGNYNAVVVGYVGDEPTAANAVQFLYISTSSDFDPNKGWKSLGYVDYTDGFVCSCPILFLPEPIQTYSLEIQESEDQAGLYRLVNPYGAAYPYSDVEEDNPYLPEYLYVDASNPESVLILESQQSFIIYAQDQAGNVVPAAGLSTCWSLADYYIQNGYTEEAAEFVGKYADGKITFPTPRIVQQGGQQYLSSALVAYWEFPDSPGDDGLYSANLVMDYESYEKSGQTDPYLYVNGEFYAPFLIDMSSLTSEANYRQNGQVMLTSHAITVPGRTVLSKAKMTKKPMTSPVNKQKKMVKKSPTSAPRLPR